MHMMKLFLKFELEKISKYFKTKTTAKGITFLLFILVFLFVGMGIYFFFVSGFRYIKFVVEPEIQIPLTLFLYELFLLVLAGVIVFSSTVSGIFTLFRGEYDAWVLSSPGYKLFPRITLIKSVMSSSWPLFVMFLPAVLAFSKMHYTGVMSLFFIIVSVILFLIILNALTLSLIVVATFLYYRLARAVTFLRFNFRGMLSVLVLLIVASVALLWRTITTIDLVKVFRAEDVDTAIGISTISSHFYFLPSHPLALEIIHWQSGDVTPALLNFLMLAVLALISFFIWWFVSPLFYPLWQKFQEGDFKIPHVEGSSSIKRTAYHFSGSNLVALFKKEALVSSRNGKGVLWFLFLLCIWLAQLGISVISSKNLVRYQIDVSEKTAILQAIQFIIAIYFMCAFTLRFVFPSFSVEKKTAWILASAPLSFKKIFLGKYLFYTTWFLVLGIVMNYINGTILNLPLTYAFYSMILFIVAIIFIVTLGLTLGALFPSLETDDPEAISTSMSGLFFTALSLLYGGIASLVLYATLMKGNVTLLVLFVCLTLVVVGMLLAKVLGTKKKQPF